MRKIKFRAWDKRNYEIRFGYPVIVKGRYDHFVEDITGSRFGVGINNGDYGMELMQYTGLKDRNGTEIYEGDIIRHESDIYKIYWCEKQMGFRLWRETTNSPAPLSTEIVNPEFGQIIGNVYENPKLLTDN